MRRYDEPVEVRKASPDDGGMESGVQEGGPAQFLWRGRLWQVRAVVGHWVETGPWWQGRAAQAAVGADDLVLDPGARGGVALDLLAEREVWRVEAGRGAFESGLGVFDLVLDWATGGWVLATCWD